MGLKLRPEFELLDEYFKLLYHNLRIDREFMCKVKDHIELCEYIIEADYEKSILFKTTYWWNKRAPLLGLDMATREVSVSSLASQGKSDKKYEFTASDRQFLRSLRIGAGFENDEAVE